ncbi:hemerythrin HHE cation binding domain-containing protein [Kalaharituber pfeilii]|nr:hemerythrin HHE cation binding domain-containing protein [Kalaharituber pfeilii]
MFKLSSQRAALLTSCRAAAARLATLPAYSYAPVKTYTPFFAARKISISGSNAAAMSVTEAIKHDHRELESYYHNILNAPDDDTATRWQNQFVWELARHSVGEELVVYPAMEKYLGEKGKSLADQDRSEHNELKVMLKKFQNLSSTDTEFTPTLKELYKALQDHITHEESNDLPTLESAMTGDATAEMAKSFERTKLFVPSRSHPSAPDKPPFETVAGLMAAPLDKLADIFRRFPTEAHVK